MNRTSVIAMLVVAIVAGLGGAFASQFFAQKPLAESDIRGIVSTMISDHDTAQADAQQTMTASLDESALNPLIEKYLMDNPRVLQRVSERLQDELATEEREKTRVALAGMHDQLYDDPDHVIIGNPNGDVTLIEFFDYNCVYCRQSLPDVARLMQDDPNLRIILKEFPVLSAGSLEAAKIAMAVSKTNADYWTFHQTLYTGRGQVDGDVALRAAEDLGLDKDSIMTVANSQATLDAIQRNYSAADTLGISGTPTFIIGDELIPGALGYDALKQMIDNVRACGSADCSSQG
ncbi:MAG: DsbA family protein [Hyphomicrobiaceae bacterium]|nr:DsbA family protein [Hyphomicrobiaceae bacterium]